MVTSGSSVLETVDLLEKECQLDVKHACVFLDREQVSLINEYINVFFYNNIS